jgi:septum formation protein
MKDTLYLGSQSSSRQKLLKAASIPFVVVSHTCDELVVKDNMPFDRYVMEIAQEKIRHLSLPKLSQEEDYHYVLTADTLIHIVSSGRILGKPIDRDDAKNMLRAMRNELVEVITGCCLQKHNLSTQNTSAVWSTGALIEFNVDESSIDSYFDKEPDILHASGSCMVDFGYGQSFFKSINGSYSAVIGLPLFELRQELKKMGFVF